MSSPSKFRCAVLSAVKHDYVARGLASHPRFELIVVADDPHLPVWAHERNEQFAAVRGIPYVRNVERALREFDVQVAVVSPEVERHCDLSVRAALAGKHVVQDKPLGAQRSEAERLVRAIEQTGVKFLMWNRNFIPACCMRKSKSPPEQSASRTRFMPTSISPKTLGRRRVRAGQAIRPSIGWPIKSRPTSMARMALSAKCRSAK